ncbi:hypothetical protein BASA60_001515 [Batrachochytrium salamandrivorans]|nr:hypothetical protein BASA60_001515 [Batrachochytrium salamandrivorans]
MQSSSYTSRCVSHSIQGATMDVAEECLFKVAIYKRKDSELHTTTSNWDHSAFCSYSKTKSTTSALRNVIRPYKEVFEIVKPGDLVSLARRDYGADIPYHSAWKSLRQINSASCYDNDDSFKFIGNFLERLALANEGTVVMYEKEDSRFKRTFLCFEQFSARIQFLSPNRDFRRLPY